MDIQKLHNKKIDIFGTKYTIKIVDRLKNDDDSGYYGLTHHDSRIIEIAKYADDTKQNNEDMTRTLLHEINHAIFASGQYLNANDDEPLIEWLAKCMYSLIFKQKLFN